MVEKKTYLISDCFESSKLNIHSWSFDKKKIQNVPFQTVSGNKIFKEMKLFYRDRFKEQKQTTMEQLGPIVVQNSKKHNSVNNNTSKELILNAD